MGNKPRLRIDIESCDIAIIQRESQRVVIDATDPFSADQINAMATLPQLMQAIQVSRQFYAVAQRRGRLCRLLSRRRALSFPLPPSAPVECFRENVFALGLHIDPHFAWAGGPVAPVDRKVRIDDVQVNCHGVDRFDSFAPTHRGGIALDDGVDRSRSVTAAGQNQGNWKHAEGTQTPPHFHSSLNVAESDLCLSEHPILSLAPALIFSSKGT